MKINDHTDKMFRIMKERFNSLIIAEIEKPGNIHEIIRFTLNSST